MKQLFNSRFRSLLGLSLICIILLISCKKDDDVAIKNDLRVLKVVVNGERADAGVRGQTVLTSVEFTFSHALNKTAFEDALSISPDVAYNVAYDETGSIVTLAPDVRFGYDTEYSISIPKGAYGENGEAMIADYSYELSTQAFEAPTVSIATENTSFFEGEEVIVTASIPNVIFDDVTFDLVFAGTATGNGIDYTASPTSITIPAGEMSTTFTVTAIGGDAVEGEETIIISLSNLVNGSNEPAAELTLLLGDAPPKMELKGVMELDNYINGLDGRVRAIHLEVLEDIADLSTFHIQIASNGAAPDPTDIDFVFPAVAAAAGDNLFVVRDADAALAATYFGSCYADFTEFQSGSITHNGNDAILLYENGVAIESFGEPGLDGSGLFWEYTDSWAYKIGGVWEYAGAGCVENAAGEATNETSDCQYPFCSSIQLQGVSALLWDGSGTNGGKFVHVRVNRDISDLSQYSIGVANNGLGTDGPEFTFPAESAKAGDHILIAREPETIASYLGSCYNEYAKVYQADAMSQNGDDAIELFDGATVIETYGDANVDGTGTPSEYSGTWAYKIGKWTYGAIDCAATSTTTQSSDCPYAFCLQ